MDLWTLVELAETAGRVRSAKLDVFRRAQDAGLALPPGVVLVRSADGASVIPHAQLQETLADRFRRTLGEEPQEVVLRSVDDAPGCIWRATHARLASVQETLDQLLRRRPEVTAVLVQVQCMQGSEFSTITWSSLGNGARAWGYRQQGMLCAERFDANSPGFDRIASMHQQLQESIGNYAQARYGAGRGSTVLLSVWPSPFPLFEHAEVALRLAELGEGSRAHAIAAVAAVVDADGSTLRLNEESARSRAMPARSMGRAWTTGRAAFSIEAQARLRAAGDPVILVRDLLRSTDVGAIRDAAGVLAVSEGVSSHFALLANSLGKPCMVDVKGVQVLDDAVIARSTGQRAFIEGDWITLDERASVLFPSKATQAAGGGEVPQGVLGWACSSRHSSLLVNCEEAEELLRAEALGAEGVGLCRSERHLVLSEHGVSAFQATILSQDPVARRSAINDVCQVLGTALEQLIQDSRTRRVSYRLLDPDPADFDLSEAPRGSARTSDAAGGYGHQSIGRGAAFRHNFEDLYLQQIATAIAAAARVTESTHAAVNLALVVPMVSDAPEYLGWVRRIRSMALPAEVRCAPLLTIKAGAMIETPRGALIAADLAGDSDVLLIGTNDLTATVWGIDRFARQSTLGLSFDPLRDFDDAVIGRLLAASVAEARRANPGVTITVCGAHASNPKDAKALLATGVTGLSCNVAIVPRMTLELAQLTESGVVRTTQPSPSVSARQFHNVMNEALPRIEGGRDLRYRHAALNQWAAEISADLGVLWTGVWKFFKRDLAVRWFGEREARRFMPPWKLDDALEYALSARERTRARMRFSVFPPHIACRAYSEMLPEPADAEAWRHALGELNGDVPMEVFPQQAHARTAFRAVLRAQTLSIEGAAGQAIDVFWKAPADLFSLEYDGCTGAVQAAGQALAFTSLLTQHLSSLFARAASLRDYLGVDWVSIEGYAGPEPEASLFVADVDLPLDAALIESKAPSES